MVSTNRVITSGRSGAESPTAPTNAPRRRGSRPRILLWLAPALILIVGVVLYPTIALIQGSLQRYSTVGISKGYVGLANFERLFQLPDLLRVTLNTIYWVVAVVILTIVISLGIAQLLYRPFVGNRLLRWLILLPWAASLIITSRLFQLLYDYNYGLINRVLLQLHLISEPIDWLGDRSLTLHSMVVVGVFVSLPFTVFVFIAGLSSIPVELYEATAIDGASAPQTYRTVTLPLLKPSILVAVVFNVIYVFNSFPIIWVLNGRNPGYSTDILVTYAYKIAFASAHRDVGLAAAVSIVNVALILVAVLVYLRFNKSWRNA